ncbi:BlaI/MecI/CopY family transcriptional regulator [Candidatus Dojkabacteria bacterium]|uniref:BlaI/MecI/CopY family transcriptional regulator n=1 Tax=Candidatus Dojkabacteria bacterium TaxID=2099670 RepID=A0A955L8K7_9BACT|nr:BlaI/MecI/CopY family transcriptional regulator [Candidatus Dojkabacteria bacterium]
MKLLGELEQRIMDIIWSHDNALKPAQVLDELDCGLAYTTIMTVMKRLVEKDVLKRYKCGNYYCYTAKKSKEDLAEKSLPFLFQDIVSSYGELAIAQFVDTLRNSPKDIELLKEYVEKSNK